MLKSLSVENFAVTKSAHLEFSVGFCALTGETGAGKSMLVDALTAALGSRAESSWVRQGCAKATVSAVFQAGPAALQWLAQRGIDCEQGEAGLRRVVEAKGGSKAWINGVSVSASELRELGGLLAAIHGQHESVALLGSKAQRDHLDAYAKSGAELEAVGLAHNAFFKAREQARSARERFEGLAREKSQLAWEIDELERLSPKEGEWESLDESLARLSRSADIQQACEASSAELTEQEGDIVTRLSKLAKSLGSLPAPALREAGEALAQAARIAQEASRDISRYMDAADLSQEGLSKVESRMGQYHDLSRKLRIEAGSMAGKLEQSRSRMASLDKGLDVEALALAEEAARKALGSRCAALTKARSKHAQKLADAATSNLAKLGMPKAKLIVGIEPKEPGPDGADHIEFAMAGFEGAKALPIAKCASGGELARIGLALCAASIGQDQPGCMVFDEVDAGIGGPTATMVGQMLRDLGSRGQALAVTHLPQVAAKADSHYAVGKKDGPLGPESVVKSVTGAAREQEVARMLGDATAASAREHARSLLAKAS